jgi:transposase
LRDLTFIEEELKQKWAKDMKVLLLEMKETVEQARVRGQPELATTVLAPLLTRYDQIVQAGYQINPLVTKPKKSDQYKRLPGKPRQSPARNLLDRLPQRKWDVLRFLLDLMVPFENNQAERDLRMIKVQQKISGCFRTEEEIALLSPAQLSLNSTQAGTASIGAGYDWSSGPSSFLDPF